jgi:hypothetical protein
MGNLSKGTFWYLAPFVFCKNEYFRHDGGFPLPFDNLPQTDNERMYTEEAYQQVWPPDGWKATFGCFVCGLVEVYEADDVEDSIVLKASEAVYHSDGVCMCVEVQCADRYCKTPDKWYVDISGATENDLRQRLQQGHFFGKLPCGHEIRTTLDKSSFQIYRVMNRLWPKL